MSDLAAAHHQLKDAIGFDESARSELKEIERRYRAAQAKAKRGQEGLASALSRLDKSTVTFQGLQKTQVGVTVNKLRKHELTSVQVAAERLVRQWKSLVEQHTAHTLPRAAQQQAAASSSARAAAAGAASSRAGVLDSVRDEHGRVERRVAHPDSHEDQLALTEAEEAERMWEEQMGGGGRRDGAAAAPPPPLRRTRSWDERADAAARAGRPLPPQPPTLTPEEARRNMVSAQLKERYSRIDAEKRSHQIMRLDADPQKKRKGGGPAPSSARARHA